jgi:hypothetical protein
MAGSVSTLPGSFKEFLVAWASRPCVSTSPKKAPKLTDKMSVPLQKIRQNIFRCIEHISHLSEKSKHQLHLGLEPEPLGLFENSAETILFFEKLRAENKNDPRLDEFLGVNYDCCHFALEFEEPQNALAAFQNAGIKISKIHLSSALKCQPTIEARTKLKKFADDIYLHQVIAKKENGKLNFFRDLPDALATSNPHSAIHNPQLQEWRIHFHVPLHAPAAPPFENTNDHLLGTLDWLAENPKLCSHLEMETYTWEVLPPELKSQNVVAQLAAEYQWTLAQLAQRGIVHKPSR